MGSAHPTPTPSPCPGSLRGFLLPALLLLLGLLSTPVNAADVYDCAAHPGTFLEQVEEAGKPMSCKCVCDLEDISAACWACPAGFAKKQADNKCVKVEDTTVMVPRVVPLECPMNMDQSVEDGMDGIKVVFCLEKNKGSCPPINQQGSQGAHQVFGDGMDCLCKKKYPLTCKDLGKGTKLSTLGKSPECNFEEPVAGKTVTTAPPVIKCMLDGTCSGWGADGTLPIQCPRIIDVPPSAVFCGPDTPEFVFHMFEKIAEQLDNDSRGKK